jgi:transcriptional regulator with XRE-family HTH domain
MSDEVGIFRTTLSKWEKGLIIPQADIKYIIRKFNSVAAK